MFFDNLVFWYTVAALQSWLSWHIMTVDAVETSSPCEDALIISFAVLKPSVINWGTQLSLSVDIVDSDRGTSSPLFSVVCVGGTGNSTKILVGHPGYVNPLCLDRSLQKGPFLYKHQLLPMVAASRLVFQVPSCDRCDKALWEAAKKADVEPWLWHYPLVN